MTPADTRLAALRSRLVAHTELIADAGSLLDHLGPDGTAWIDGPSGFVTAGIAAVVDPANAVATLRSIEHRCEPHRPGGLDPIGPRAMGALPFAGLGRIVARDSEGRTWHTIVEPPGAQAVRSTRARSVAPASFTITQITGPDAWDANVAAVLALIDAGAAEKVVLAREVVIDASEPFDIAAVAARLCSTQPGCIVYVDNGFVGASPELLVRRTGNAVTARPMAGTGQRADALLHSEKDAREHQLVVDAVVDTLRTMCADTLAHGAAPVGLADLTHLATTITARITDPDTSAVDLALALHPTPAVAGTPRATALAAIARLEPTPRDCYAGPCGWVDARGDGEFVVALRGAQTNGARARLHAGAGIVAGSRADAEWAETQVKLEPMLRALVRI